MAEVLDVVREAPRQYARIARLWIRSSLSYRTSFAILTLSSMLITFLDFVGLWLMLHLIGDLDGWALWEIALLYGASGIGIGVADLLIGSVEQIGQHIRTGTLDAMLVRPVPLLVQVCADRFAIRRLGRITQAVVVFAWGAWHVDWTPTKVVVALLMMVSASVIFFALFVAFSCVQFWTQDASEFANAFTYGGNTMTQYPLSIFPIEVGEDADVRDPRRLRQLVPLPLPPRPRGPVRLPGLVRDPPAPRRRPDVRDRRAGLAHRRAPLHLHRELTCH